MNDMMKYATKYKTNKDWSLFADVYHMYFSSIRKKARKVLEIGVYDGGSLHMWRDYFKRAHIYGIDIDDRSCLDEKRITTYIADQADRRALQGFLSKHGGEFDIIVDDGGHGMEQQQVSLGKLFPHVKTSGYYVIEDITSSKIKTPPWPETFGIKPDGSNSTLRMLEGLYKKPGLKSEYLSDQESGYIFTNLGPNAIHNTFIGRTMLWIGQKWEPRRFFDTYRSNPYDDMRSVYRCRNA
jgi:hypothetical protein